jgi:hypothetical protein
MKSTNILVAAMSLVMMVAVGPSKLFAAEETPATKPSDATEGPAKFYGPITAVDAKSMTFTIGDQTFSVIGETNMTKDDRAATIDDAVVGEPARGTYTKASDGKLNVTKVRFGKKGGGKGKEKGADKEPATQPAN